MSAASLERIWITHSSRVTNRITVSWETSQPAPSLVEYGSTPELGKQAASDERVTLHHVEISLDPKSARHHYRVRSGDEVSAIHSFKGYTAQELRVGIFADRGYARDIAI